MTLQCCQKKPATTLYLLEGNAVSTVVSKPKRKKKKKETKQS